jgi:hypothetical protein
LTDPKLSPSGSDSDSDSYMDYVLTDTLVKIVMSGYFPRDFLIKLLEVFIFSIQATWPGHHEFYYTKELATIPQMQIYDV